MAATNTVMTVLAIAGGLAAGAGVAHLATDRGGPVGPVGSPASIPTAASERADQPMNEPSAPDTEAAAAAGSPEGAATEPAPAFHDLGLDAAIAQARRTDRPVVAVVTATWCPPCQRLKNETLSEESVQTWLSENAVAVQFDADRDRDAAMRLGVRSIPATIVIDGENVVAHEVGFRGAPGYIAMLDRAVGG